MSIEDDITPGKILYLNVCFPQQIKPENKYLLVLEFGPPPLLLKINSQQKNDSDLRLKRTTYPFFPKEESFLNFGNIWNSLITAEEIINQISNDGNRIKGDITDDHKNEIIHRVEKSREISPIHRRIIIRALRKK